MTGWENATTRQILDDIIAATRRRPEWSATGSAVVDPISTTEFRQWDATETVRQGAIARWNEAQR